MTYGQLDYTYNGCGALTSDSGNGIAMIEYDNSNNPLRIQFTNGNVTRYIYTTTGQKLRTIYYTAMSNITVSIGETRPLSQAEILYTDSIDYLLNGSLILRNGRIDKYMFGEGYCQAWIPHACFARPMMFEGDIFGDGSLIIEPTEEDWEAYKETLKRWGEIGAAIQASDDFTFYYYNKDHLGNIREVVDEMGNIQQVTNYYPFGMPYYDSRSAINPEFQPFKYNGKELDMMHGLNTLDYGARQYDPVLPVWDRVDPLAEKYYHISPYMYCLGNPVRFIDTDGKKVYLFATTLPMDNNIAKSIIEPATHTFIVVTNNENKPIRYAAYGPENGNILGKDRLMECHYTQDIKVYKDFFNSIENDNLKMAIEIPAPNGMTSEQFDKKVVKMINNFGNNEGIKYSIFPMTEIQGNCNTSSSTILNKSGVSKQIMQLIEKIMPGISTGFNSDSTKPWTKAEQEKAVEKAK